MCCTKRVLVLLWIWFSICMVYYLPAYNCSKIIFNTYPQNMEIYFFYNWIWYLEFMGKCTWTNLEVLYSFSWSTNVIIISKIIYSKLILNFRCAPVENNTFVYIAIHPIIYLLLLVNLFTMLLICIRLIMVSK